MKKTYLFLLGAGVMFLLTSCSLFSSREVEANQVSRQVAREYFSQMIFNRDGLSFDTENFLRGNLMLKDFDDDPVASLRKINSYYQISGEPEYLEIAADLCRWLAQHSDPETAIRYHLAAFYYCRSAAQAQQNRRNLAQENTTRFFYGYRMLLIYNEACYGLFSYLREHGLLDRDAFELQDIEGRKFVFTPSRYQLSLPREQVADFLPCPDYQIKDLSQKNMRLGIGLPLIGVIKTGDVYQSLHTPVGLTIPVTMLAFFKERPDHSFSANMLFLDASTQEAFHWNNSMLEFKDLPLALDFSTPFAYFLGKLPEQNLISLMLNPNEAEKNCGLYMLEPYQPHLIPVVFVHGLMSSPGTWSQMINSLRSNPIIRQKYQFWFYYYSSGVPIPVSGKKLSDSLYAVQKELCKTEAEKKNFENMIIVGHSMGGLITRTLIQQNSHELAEGLSHQTWEELTKNLKPEEIAKLEGMIDFPPLPIHRVIFMAVPHRGSKMAKWSIARLGSRLITFPASLFSSIVTLQNIFKSNYKLLPELNEFYTGIDNLDPDSRFTKGLQKTSINRNVIYHSIIGDQDGDNHLGGSDGVVPYSSSHLDGAASELVVKSGHSVHRQPAAIREVMRILLLHVKELQ